MKYKNIVYSLISFAVTFLFLSFTFSKGVKFVRFSGLFIFSPIVGLLMGLLTYFGIRRNFKSKKTIYYSFLIGSISLLFVESIMIIITIHSWLTLLFLIIIDAIILLFPLYLNKSRNIGEYNEELTERIRALTSDSDTSVYLKNHGSLLRRFSGFSKNRIILFKDSMSELNPEEIDALLLESYYSGKIYSSGNLSLNVNKLTAFIISYFDAFLIIYIISMNTSPKYGMYFIVILLALIILFDLLVILYSKFYQNKFLDVDDKILQITGNKKALLSLLEKELGSITLFMLNNVKYSKNSYFKRRKDNILKRISKLEKQ